MSGDLSNTIAALAALMDEEVAILKEPGGHRRLAEIAARKAGTVGAIEAETARRAREDADWADHLPPLERERLFGVLAELKRAGAENAAALKRQIDLSVDLMVAVAAEVRGPGGGTYGANGAMRGRAGGAVSRDALV